MESLRSSPCFALTACPSTTAEVKKRERPRTCRRRRRRRRRRRSCSTRASPPSTPASSTRPRPPSRKVLEKAARTWWLPVQPGRDRRAPGRPHEAPRSTTRPRTSSTPSTSRTLLNLGKVYRLQDKFDEAIALYEAALKEPGNEYDVELLNNLTVAYRLAKKFDKAEATAAQGAVAHQGQPRRLQEPGADLLRPGQLPPRGVHLAPTRRSSMRRTRASTTTWASST